MTHAAPGALAALTLLFAVAGWSETVGETSYVEGSVAVYRAGVQLTGGQVDVGTSLENYDIVETGEDGTLELRLSAGPSPDTLIRVDPRTTFSIEVGKTRRQPATTVDMISGTLTMKVQRITGTGTVTVRTESAIMGVRGTAFAVTTPPNGDILVTVSEGEVVCTDAGGAELRALPGTAVEKIAGERFRAIPVAVSSLDTFRASWTTERITALRSNALRAIQDNAARYTELSRAFNDQYRDLAAESEVLNTWADEDRAGRTPGFLSARILAEKKRLIGPLLKLRATLFVFERVYYRLNELEQYHREGYGRGRIDSGLSTDEFFTRTAAERRDLAQRLSRVQYAARLYAARNDGEFPAGLLGDPGDADSFDRDFDAPDDMDAE